MENGKKETYSIGIVVKSKEDYDRLMKDHSTENWFIGLDFKGLFQGYPKDDQYPCLVEYTVDSNPMGFSWSLQLNKIIEAGYKVVLNKE